MEHKPFSVTIGEIAEKFKLEVISEIEGMYEVEINSTDINRPSLQIAGFFDYFDESRIQMIGKVETTYMENMTYEKRYKSIDNLFQRDIPMLIVTRGLDIFPEMIELSKKHGIPIFRTSETTSAFLSAIISYLNVELAPRITRHGVLVEVYGEGVLILGESGVGKSETAVELVKRGHRLVADDAVEIKRVSAISLVGSAPEIIRHFIEIRGIGIIDVQKIFGMGAVKNTEKIDLVIQLEAWDDTKKYDRLGLVDEYIDILGINIPALTIPVRPGRNLAIIVEVAAMNNRQKKMGYNSAEVLNSRLMESVENENNKN